MIDRNDNRVHGDGLAPVPCSPTVNQFVVYLVTAPRYQHPVLTQLTFKGCIVRLATWSGRHRCRTGRGGFQWYPPGTFASGLVSDEAGTPITTFGSLKTQLASTRERLRANRCARRVPVRPAGGSAGSSKLNCGSEHRICEQTEPPYAAGVIIPKRPSSWSSAMVSSGIRRSSFVPRRARRESALAHEHARRLHRDRK